MGKISRRHFVHGTGAGLVAAKLVPRLHAQQATRPASDPPGFVEERGNEVVIGGSITLSELAGHPLIRGHYAALAESARAVGNAGTLAKHFPEIDPALVALDAKFKIAGSSGEVRLPGCKGWTFYTPYSTTTGGNTLRSTYRKGVAVALEIDGSVCKKARIVLSGVRGTPWRATTAEALLEGKRITRELAAEAGQAASEDKLTKTTVKRVVAALGSA